ncbi:chymotrypsinogen A-like [Branchiostoma floridae x Branchiostoma japonicum]
MYRSFGLYLTLLAVVQTVYGDCGTRTTASARIVGGRPASVGAWPWQVQVLVSDSSGQQGFCGGTLIHPRWVLTAEHCFDGATSNLEDTTVLVGKHNLDPGNDTTEVTRTADVIHHHHDYHQTTLANDMALVRLNDAVDTSQSAINIACLPDASDTFPAGTNCTATGWGVLEDGGTQPTSLYQVELPVIERSLCAQAYNTFSFNQLCAGDWDNGGIDTCQGDSGGPLVCQKDGNGSWYLAGVTSFGGGCALEQSPGVYSKVTDFLDWISPTCYECTGNSSCAETQQSGDTTTACGIGEWCYLETTHESQGSANLVNVRRGCRAPDDCSSEALNNGVTNTPNEQCSTQNGQYVCHRCCRGANGCNSIPASGATVTKATAWITVLLGFIVVVWS